MLNTGFFHQFSWKMPCFTGIPGFIPDLQDPASGFMQDLSGFIQDLQDPVNPAYRNYRILYRIYPGFAGSCKSCLQDS
jgi:hypothetical protein